MRLLKAHPLLRPVTDMLVDLPGPANLSYAWNFGSLLGLSLGLQIITGIFLAMHYTPHIEFAFSSVEHIMRDVNYGWVIRYAHANGASMFFLTVYLHIGRGIYYGSYLKPKVLVWIVGVIILVLMMLTGFIGYVLPWGQMSFWGATVITNLLSAIPIVGKDLVEWVWGGFSVDNATLNRFFSLHYLLPFLIAVFVIIHLMALHLSGSNNPTGLKSDYDKVPFHPYFSLKDLVGALAYTITITFFIFWAPNYLGHTDNYIPANPLVTPAHIAPEWYLLFAYTILRSINNKTIGVIALFASLLILLVLPFSHTSVFRSSMFRPINRKAYWFFIANVLILTWIGALPVEEPYVIIGQTAAITYFAYFALFTPLIGWTENFLLKTNIANF